MFRPILKYWLPVAIWTALILAGSGAELSFNHTGSFLSRVLSFLLHRPVTEEEVHPLHVAIRKSGHVLEYAILGALLFRAVRSGRAGFEPRWAVAAFAITVAIACIDEWRQEFAPGRTPAIHDVAIDAAGAAAAQAVIRLRNRPR